MQKFTLRGILATLLALICAACGNQQTTHTFSGGAWGTTYQVKIVSQDGALDEAEVKAAIRQTLIETDEQFSNWNPESEVSRFNTLPVGEPARLSPEFNSLMSVANNIHTASDGYFDLTLAPIIELWGFGSEQSDRQRPSDAAIAKAMRSVGQGRVVRHDPASETLQKADKDATIFLSAIAKGEGIDALASAIGDLGYENFMIEVGGDLIALGSGPSGQGWKIAIEQPKAGKKQAGDVLALAGQAMATSGDYRNYYEQDGTRYSHIIDPKTGRPITHRTASVTVLAATAIEADGWATALLAAGSERGMEIAEREEIAALFIDRGANNADFVSQSSAGFNRMRAGN